MAKLMQCDMCGKHFPVTIKNGLFPRPAHTTIRVDGYDSPLPITISKAYDVCRECSVSFGHWMRQREKQVTCE